MTQHVVRIPWRHNDTISRWDEVCIWAIEQFGLPGNRYFAEVGLLNMTVIFKNPQDLLLFKLKWSEYEF